MSNRTIMPSEGFHFDNPNQAAVNVGPVECLGQTFESDAARREHYLRLLAEKLKDPEFRKIEGFPIGEDEDILNLSDPPYYTACPNPFIGDFITHYGRLYDSSEEYKREPFAAEIKEGKNEAIFNAHGYHTKVPHKALMRFILHYTQPGDLILDSFCGSGMTGVAAQLCGDSAEVAKLGYVVSGNLSVLSPDTNEEISRVGARYAIMNDLAPAATFMSSVFNQKVDKSNFLELRLALDSLETSYSWAWETSHIDGRTKGKINYVVWSEVFLCPECANEINYYQNAFESIGDGAVVYKEVFRCPGCNAAVAKKPKKDSGISKLERKLVSIYDEQIGETIRQQERVPSLINYKVGEKRFNKIPDEADLKVIADCSLSRNLDSTKIPCDRMCDGGESRRNDSEGLTHVHHFYTKRNLLTISNLLATSLDSRFLHFVIGSVLPKLTILNRFMPQHGSRALVGPMANTLYVPPVSVENNAIEQIRFQLKKIEKALNSYEYSTITTQSSQSLNIPPNSIDYIFIDPPFGANIMYSELSYIREAWLKCFTNSEDEAIENKNQNKSLDFYLDAMKACFKECYFALKPGRWMTVEFSNTKASVWNAIQTAIAESGFIVAAVNSLDKERGGLHAMLGPTAVKQDLVISAYKPGDDFENRFKIESDMDGVWDFIRTHLGYLPVVKKQLGELVKIPERDPRVLFDQVVVYFVQNMRDVPISSKEFQEGLKARFAERDGMVFLPEHVAEYDKARINSKQLKQLAIFVDDEASSIEWLRQLLNEKPQSYQNIHPSYLNELGGWKKAEEQLELSTLLEQNFIKYDGVGPLPPQIHSYLSTNFKEFRNLKKDDPQLLKKAKDRWYVPNPDREEDLQKLRERSLLSEFMDYKNYTGKKLKKVRMEAVRCGFKKAWQERDYSTIISVAEKIPQDLLQEDQKLLMWYDQAQTRASDENLF